MNTYIDLNSLIIGKVYPAFKDGRYLSDHLCFVKIKDKIHNGYIVDIEFNKQIVATDQPLIYKKDRKIFMNTYKMDYLTTTGKFKCEIEADIQNAIYTLVRERYLTIDELTTTIL